MTTDNFFTSVDLFNRLKDRSLTLVRTMKQNKKEIPTEFKPVRPNPEYSSLFGFTKELTLVSYVPRKNKSVVFLGHFEHNVRSILCTASHPKMDHGDVLRSGKRCFNKCICCVCAQHAQTTKTHETKT